MSVNKNRMDNLVNISEQGLTPEQLKENGRKGGQASGETRRQKKIMKDLICDILDMNVKAGDHEEFLNLAESKGKNISVSQAIILAQVKKAMNGDTRAVEFLRDTAGMKPVDKKEVDTKITNYGKLDDIFNILNGDQTEEADTKEEIKDE